MDGSMALAFSHSAPLLSASRPIRSLATLFVAWKGFLLAVALGAAVGPDYDTSTALFLEGAYGSQARVPALAVRLTRWDALYFLHHVRRGYVYEQQWAFGAAMPALVRVLSEAVLPSGRADVLAPLVAMAVAHGSHWLAVLALHRLTMVVYGDAKLALVAAALHVVSPAGLFLSAPYAESPFACLSFVGCLLFALGIRNRHDALRRAVAVAGAGLALGLATAFRSNGLSFGLLFAVGVARCLVLFARDPGAGRLVALAAPVVGGLCVAAGSVVPQAVAWKRYCRAAAAAGVEPRPWCSRAVPSIYAFVQAEYWNIGFLRYWTLNQLPLFLLASPMLAILMRSGLGLLRDPRAADGYGLFVRTLASTQALVALLAVTNYHVQIISRLSSGYPVWYWWVAGCLMDRRQQGRARAMVVFMVMYAGIQGALFASFLPPA